MRRIGGIGLAAAMVLGTVTLAPALAQSVGDFRLQPRETSAPRPQGPVDSDAPVVRSVVRPSPTEAPPAPQPAPAASTPAPAATPSASPRPVATTAPVSARPPAPATDSRRPEASPSPSASSPAPQASASPVPEPVATEAPDSQAPVIIETFEPSPSATRRLPFDLWWLAAPAGVLLILAIWLLRRGKSEGEPEDDAEGADFADYAEEFSADADPAPEPEPQPEPALMPPTPPLPTPALGLADSPPQPARTLPVPPAAKPAPAPAAPVAASWTGEKLAISLELGRMSATLVNSAISWKLRIENRGNEPLGPVAVAGDMVAAHASLPVEQQLATDGQPLELIDQLDPIGPGEQTEVSGEFRVPLSAISPIKAGSALLFIPLLRFRVEADGASTLATFAIGETPPVAAAALLPFRLDLGPRVWSKISHRQVDRPVVSV